MPVTISKEWKTGIYCKEHMKIGMVYAGKRTCADEECEKQPNYNIPTEKKGLYCAGHKKEGMICVTQKRCKEKGCMHFPAYNYEGKRPEYCGEHKTDDMVNISKKCSIKDCNTHSCYVIKTGRKHIKYCAKHRPENAMLSYDNTCLDKSCKTRASFGYEKIGKKMYCGKHKLNGMICLVKVICIEDNCTLAASFNDPNKQGRIYCAQHKKEGMVNKKNGVCINEDCKTFANFNYPGLDKGLYCYIHMKHGMVNIRKDKCHVDDCMSRAKYGNPGNQAIRCTQHKEDNMILNPTKKCEKDNCKEIALYGFKTARYCEDHSNKKMINFIENKCKSCEMVWLLNNDGVCTYCDPKHFNGFRLAKQNEIKLYLDNNKYNYESYDKTIDNGICNKYRPDFVFESESGGHHVVLEVDEYQHNFKKGHYKEECECVRMVNISQSLGMPTIFIRYNPDKYTGARGKTYNPTFNTRIKALKTVLDNCLNMDINDVKERGYLSMIQLYYDGYGGGKYDFTTILDMEKENKLVV